MFWAKGGRKLCERMWLILHSHTCVLHVGHGRNGILKFQVRNCMDPEITLQTEIFRNQKVAQITTSCFTKLPAWKNNLTLLSYSISLKSLWFGKNAHETVIAIITSDEWIRESKILFFSRQHLHAKSFILDAVNTTEASRERRCPNSQNHTKWSGNCTQAGSWIRAVGKCCRLMLRNNGMSELRCCITVF